MFIRGENIELRAIEPDDYLKLTQILEDPQIQLRLFGYPLELGKTTFDDWLKASRHNKQVYYFAIKETGDLDVVGICAYQDIDYRNGSVTLWAAIAPECEAKGYGEQALKMLSINAFDQLRMEHIALYCLENDQVSKDWAQQAGFSRNVILKSRIEKEDKRLDLELYSLQKEEGVG